MPINWKKLFSTCAGALIVIGALSFFTFVLTSDSKTPRKSLIVTKFNGVNKESGWEINNYDVVIHLKTDGSFDVEENITTNFDTYKHGIYRDIPVYYERKLDNGLYVDSVLNLNNFYIQQNESPATTSSHVDRYLDFTYHNPLYGLSAQTKFIRIGDPDKTINGEVKYRISYNVKNGLTEDGNGNYQLYWNATGNGWGVPINNATVRVSSDDVPLYKDTQCYSGSFGTNNGNCTVNTTENKNSVSAKVLNLNAGEGLTILANLNPSAKKYFVGNVGGGPKEITNLMAANWFLLLPVIPFLAVLAMWILKGRSPKTRGIIAPRFDSPNGITPAQSGVIVDESADNIDMTATIIWLATKGFLKIQETENGAYILWKLTPTNPIPLTVEDQLLYEKLFSGGDKIYLSSLKDKFYTTAQRYKELLYSWGRQQGFFVRTPGPLSAPLLFAYAFGVIPLIALIGTKSPLLVVSIAFFMILSVPCIVMFQSYSATGKALQEELLGLKMYIDTAEKDRIKFLNAPERTPELFERLLPYAMVLGSLSIWADQFKNIYTSPPSWYDGNWNNFNTLYFVNSISHASSSIASTMTSAPSSSSGGGGGFSGGGGGGGGGGSW